MVPCESNAKKVASQAAVWATVFQEEEIGPMWRGVRNGLEASEEHTGPGGTPKSGTKVRKTGKGHVLSWFK